MKQKSYARYNNAEIIIIIISLPCIQNRGVLPGGEFLLELCYSDPRDSKLYTEPGADPAGENELIYKLYVGPNGLNGNGGGDYYYCRPYGNAYQAIAVKGETVRRSNGNRETF